MRKRGRVWRKAKGWREMAFVTHTTVEWALWEGVVWGYLEKGGKNGA